MEGESRSLPWSMVLHGHSPDHDLTRTQESPHFSWNSHKDGSVRGLDTVVSLLSK